MALLEDIIREVPSQGLRERLLGEVRKLKADKKFGLVYEDHLPEVVPLFGTRVRVGMSVARRAGPMGVVYRVLGLRVGLATCQPELPTGGETVELAVDDLVPVKRFGEPIFPTLTEVDAVERALTDVPAHVLIEADNYHALQLLAYAHAGQVDCIYIDPPYNTGARDWKYNNDYVDGADGWRHSKWLAFMEKRLRLAKQLLKPDTGVMIVTIDEHEVHHLGLLLGEVFPEAVRQMVTIVINPKGVTQGRFSRVEEYAQFCFMPQAFVTGLNDDLLTVGQENAKSILSPRWKGLLRAGTNARRVDRKRMFFPVLIDVERGAVVGTGEPLPYEELPDFESKINGYTPVWPIRTDNSLGNWGVGHTTLRTLIDKGYVSLGGYDKKRKTYGLTYLSKRPQSQIESGILEIIAFDEQKNVVNVRYKDASARQVKTIWHRTAHDAGAYGSDLLSRILGEKRFSFPKSIYATRDALASVVRDRPQALIVDFFAGSGTTLNAVNLLNAVDGGQRRCILVTNNEVSAEEADNLTTQGLQPGQSAWEAQGICQSVTWPRSKFTVNGRRDDDTFLTGDYLTGKTRDKETARRFVHLGFTNRLGIDTAQKRQLVAMVEGLPQNLVTNGACPFIVSASHTASVLFDDAAAPQWLDALEDQDQVTDLYIVTHEKRDFEKLKAAATEVLGTRIMNEEEKRPLAAGFEATVRYFKLDFLDPTAVEMGRAFERLLPTLWLMAGGYGPIPAAQEPGVPYLLAPESRLAVLHHSADFPSFEEALARTQPLLHKVFLVTDSADEFYNMQAALRLALPQLPTTACVQLYRNYLDNFRINTGDLMAAAAL